MIKLTPLLLIPLVACQVDQDRSTVEARIAQVENELVTGVAIQGEPRNTTTLLEQLVHHGVPAVSIAVINNEKLEWARAYGMADVGEDRPATPSTLFQAASISKPVAATGALTYVQAGALTLDQNVNELLRNWNVPENRHTTSERVTLRRLVTHSAGMTVHGFPGYARDVRIPTTIEVLDGAGNTDPIRVDTIPGSLWRYSGGGYTVMQQLLVDVSGLPFPQVQKERVLEPFGMASSTYEQPLPEARHAEAATAYRGDGIEIEGKWHVYPEMAAAGLWTTPTDLARFALGILDAYHGRSESVLDRETARAMLTPGINNHGLGPSIGSDGLFFGHGGSNAGFRCQLYAFVETGQGVAVMTNSDNGGVLIQEIIHTLAEVYDWPALKPEVKEVADVDPSLLVELAGRYDIQGEIVVQLEVVDGRLWADVPGEGRLELLPESDTVFFSRTDGTRVTFIREQGRVVAFSVEGMRAERMDEG